MSDDWQKTLTPFAREVLASAEDDGCDDVAFERMNKQVLAAAVSASAVAAGAASASAASAGAASGNAVTATSAVLATKAGIPTLGAVFVKALVALSVGSTVIGGTLWATSALEDDHVVDSPHADASTQDSPAPVGEPTREGTAEPTEPDPETPTRAIDEAVSTPDSEEPGLAAGTIHRPQPTESPNPPGAEPDGAEPGGAEPDGAEPGIPEAGSVSLGDELRLLRELQRSVQTRPERAVQLADEHEARFGASDLGSERELHRIRALVRLQRHAAADQARERFHSNFPASPYGPRIDALVSESPTE